jgi:hypothetical protein
MNIGIIIPSLDMNQLAYEVISTINRTIAAGDKNDYRIFFEELVPKCIDPICSVMNITEIFSYDGILISTTLDNTKLALKALGNVDRYFYIWDLEFLRNRKDYLNNISVYRNPKTKIIARSNDQATAIKNYCGITPQLIMPNLNFNEIMKVSEKKNERMAQAI